MFQNIDLFTYRYMQITICYMLFAAIVVFMHIPHSIWIILTGSMLYSGFHPGTIIKRSFLRLKGTIIGIAAAFIFWHIIHIDYRLANLSIPIIFALLCFYRNLSYDKVMIIMTVMAVILIQATNTSSFHLSFFIIDRLICTIIVFALCYLVEYFWFGRNNLTYLNYNYQCKSLLNELERLLTIVQSKHLSYTKLLDKIRLTHEKINYLNGLVLDAKYHGKPQKFDLVAEDFMVEAVAIFRKIVSFSYLLKHNTQTTQRQYLIEEATKSLNRLNYINRGIE